jgi:outer membrane protein assembly factor BamB
MKRVLNVARALPLVLGMMACGAADQRAGTGLPNTRPPSISVGDLLWKLDLAPDDSYEFHGSPAVAGDLVVAMWPGGMLGIERRTGRVRWRDSVWTSMPAFASLSARDGTACLASVRWVGCYDTESGRRLWGAPPPRDARAGPDAITPSGLFVVLAADGVVRAYDARSGALRWATPVDTVTAASRFTVAGVVADDSLAIVDAITGPMYAARQSRGLVAALRLRDGAIVWQTRFADQPSGAAVPVQLSRDLVLVADINAGKVRALRRSTGELVWDSHSAPQQAVTSDGYLVIRGDTVFAGSPDTHVYALDPATGRVMWSIKTPASPFGLGQCGPWIVANDARLAFIRPGVPTMRWGPPGSADLNDAFGVGDDVLSQLTTAPEGTAIYVTTSKGVIAVSCTDST